MSTTPPPSAPRSDAPPTTAGTAGRAWRGLVRVLRHRRTAKALVVAAVSLVAAGVAVSPLGGTDRQIGPVDARVSIVPSLRGGTVVDLPPLGQLALDTHDGPLQVRARVDGIRLDAAQQLLTGGTSSAALVEEVTADVRSALVDVALRSAVVALVAGGLACLVVVRSGRSALAGVAVTAVALVASGGIAAATVRPSALTEPTFTGLLSQAPALIGSAQDIGTRFTTYSQQVTKLTANVTQLYGALSTLPVDTLPADDSQIAVLWVSDIHDNPEAFAVMPSLIEQFGVAAVVDTGDISDHGTAAENAIYDPVERLGVPYLYIRGNHDSALTQAHLAAMDNVVVLDQGAVADVAGLRWAGTGDPQFTPDQSVSLDEDAVQALMDRAGQLVAAGVEQSAADGEPVDVALVHRRTMADPLYGLVPLVLDGHTHRRSSTVVDGTLKLTQGSSGGAGLRTLEGGQAQALTMSVLHFDAVDKTLLAVDDITLGGLGQQSVTVERHAASSFLEGDVPDADPGAESGTETPSGEDASTASEGPDGTDGPDGTGADPAGAEPSPATATP